MTTNAMSCDVFHERLMAYLESETDDATRAAVERHAATCADCGAVLADVRKIRADAAQLPQLAPSRDLWAGIAARIEAPVLPLAPAERRTAWAGVRPSLRIALLAASLVAAAGIGYLSAGGRASPDGVAPPAGGVDATPTRVASADSMIADTIRRAEALAVRQPQAPGARPVSAGGAMSAQYAVATLTADYDREIARLRSLIDERRNQLDPATVAVIERNIQVIDAAILDSRKAIAADPSSAFLIESLNQSLRTKVELMRTAVALPIRM